MMKNWYPEMPPKLQNESHDAYTDRLTGADQMGHQPYNHVRNRQCSIGWHEECSANSRCQCPCHDQEEAGTLPKEKPVESGAK